MNTALFPGVYNWTRRNFVFVVKVTFVWLHFYSYTFRAKHIAIRVLTRNFYLLKYTSNISRKHELVPLILQCIHPRITATGCTTCPYYVIEASLKYGRHGWANLYRYLQIAWQEQIKYSKCHVADLYSVGNQFETWQGNYYVGMTHSYGFLQTK